MGYPSLSPLQTKAFLKILYSKTHNIYKEHYNNPSLNIAVNTIAYNDEVEDVNYFSGYHMFLDDYITYQINKFTGISFKEYMKLTPYETMIINEICMEITEEYNKAFEKIDIDKGLSPDELFGDT